MIRKLWGVTKLYCVQVSLPQVYKCSGVSELLPERQTDKKTQKWPSSTRVLHTGEYTRDITKVTVNKQVDSDRQVHRWTPTGRSTCGQTVFRYVILCLMFQPTWRESLFLLVHSTCHVFLPRQYTQRQAERRRNLMWAEPAESQNQQVRWTHDTLFFVDLIVDVIKKRFGSNFCLSGLCHQQSPHNWLILLSATVLPLTERFPMMLCSPLNVYRLMWCSLSR